ncbi:tRNA-dependent cyclodipeptide synthase [Gordonia humi]|uniref:Cyclodipeptide synthase n=1 Tax=Gordonia humi TaxID=686429 RepID=A0A840EU87_9ACTN|nr:tRNA-dependent cyclodipeptide synthase [Gordonia humi]MBB4133928.1 tRNA-dependent cyclodipeptide synthase [Gordonia humi]
MTATTIAPVGSTSHKAAFDLKGLQYEYTGRSTILLVSVGADYHEGEKFGATIDLLNRSGFARVTVAVADTLQRHNVDAAPGEAYELSRRRGDQWLARNRPLLDLLTADVDVLRWDTALSDPDYPRALDRVREAYRSDDEYAAAIDATIDRFVARRGEGGPDEDRIWNGCRTYLLEEVPIIQPLWAAKGYDFVVYPQQISAAMAATRARFVDDGAAWLPLRFKKRRSAR